MTFQASSAGDKHATELQQLCICILAVLDSKASNACCFWQCDAIRKHLQQSCNRVFILALSLSLSLSQWRWWCRQDLHVHTCILMKGKSWHYSVCRGHTHTHTRWFSSVESLLQLCCSCGMLTVCVGGERSLSVWDLKLLVFEVLHYKCIRS